MNRKEFIKMCGLLGIGLPFLGSCTSSRKQIALKSSDKIIVIGAGAAGLTAAHLLNQKGIAVEVLEASSIYGGRMKRTTEFTDFPIPTGAEWLHTKKNVLDQIVNNSDIQIDITTTPYNFDEDYALVEGEKVGLKDLGFTIDQKFIGSTWFDFFERYVVPNIENKIQFNTAVKSINYASDKILLQTSKAEYEADKVIITVPVKILQNKAIQFTPNLPKEKIEAINKVIVWGGCKAFIEFSKSFYPTVTGFEITPETAGHKLYYNAAYGQNSAQNILGLFAVGAVAEPYLKRTGQELISYILAELDEIFDGQASPNYLKHIFQNWTTEPFAQGAYVHYFADWKTIRDLGKSISDKLFFAGDTYTDGSEWSSVHAAAQSAKSLIESFV